MWLRKSGQVVGLNSMAWLGEPVLEFEGREVALSRMKPLRIEKQIFQLQQYE